MNLYEKIRNTECEIPEAFDLTSRQADDLIHNADPQDRYDLVYIAFKFGYMQGKRAEQASRTNEAATGEADRLREYIIDWPDQEREAAAANIYSSTQSIHQ